MQSVGQQLGISNIAAFRSHPALVTNDAIGVELELEGFTRSSTETASSHLAPLWSVTTDGSLRNGGVEFITAGGLGGERLHQAYERMVSLLDRVNYDASWRCSTHMHVNMLDFTVNQVARFMLVYAACEPIVFQHCGAFRRSSNFCTPVGDSIPFHKSLIAHLYDDVVSYRGAAGQCNKYTALNFLPLFGDGRTRALGTVEFRGGRPMVTLEDLLLQTNLLLSMKHFVRTFEGTEEQMLSRLNDGVHNVVFLNGIADTLQVNGQDLEDSLIHSWLLLKAYQEGMTQRRTAPPVRTAAPPPSGFDWGRVTRAAEATAESDGLQAMIDRVALRGFWSSSRIRSTSGAYRSVDYVAEVSGFSEDQWPRLYEYIPDIQNVQLGVRHMAEYAYMALTDMVFEWRMSSDDAIRALTMWKMAKDITLEVTPFGTVMRAVNERRRLNIRPRVNSECVALALSTQEQPQISGNLGHDMNYLAGFNIETRREVARLVGVAPSRLTNNRIWNFLLDQTIPVRAPNTLSGALGSAVGIQHNFGDGPWNVLYLRYMLKWARRSSLQHVNEEYRELYDRVNRVADILQESGFTFPVMVKRGGRHPHKIFLSMDESKLCWDIAAAQNQRRTEPRLSPTTGHLIY